mmetsp:Transcript_25396/g.53165  ORF Transcript_25396/g.53165 Transcript_25396/m.53165 type:complete len:417 (-) Transcript_25396:296-1546(-)
MVHGDAAHVDNRFLEFINVKIPFLGMPSISEGDEVFIVETRGCHWLIITFLRSVKNTRYLETTPEIELMSITFNNVEDCFSFGHGGQFLPRSEDLRRVYVRRPQQLFVLDEVFPPLGILNDVSGFEQFSFQFGVDLDVGVLSVHLFWIVVCVIVNDAVEFRSPDLNAFQRGYPLGCLRQHFFGILIFCRVIVQEVTCAVIVSNHISIDNFFIRLSNGTRHDVRPIPRPFSLVKPKQLSPFPPPNSSVHDLPILESGHSLRRLLQRRRRIIVFNGVESDEFIHIQQQHPRLPPPLQSLHALHDEMLLSIPMRPQTGLPGVIGVASAARLAGRHVGVFVGPEIDAEIAEGLGEGAEDGEGGGAAGGVDGQDEGAEGEDVVVVGEPFGEAGVFVVDEEAGREAEGVVVVLIVVYGLTEM